MYGIAYFLKNVSEFWMFTLTPTKAPIKYHFSTNHMFSKGTTNRSASNPSKLPVVRSRIDSTPTLIQFASSTLKSDKSVVKTEPGPFKREHLVSVKPRRMLAPAQRSVVKPSKKLNNQNTSSNHSLRVQTSLRTSHNISSKMEPSVTVQPNRQPFTSRQIQHRSNEFRQTQPQSYTAHSKKLSNVSNFQLMNSMQNYGLGDHDFNNDALDDILGCENTVDLDRKEAAVTSSVRRFTMSRRTVKDVPSDPKRASIYAGAVRVARKVSFYLVNHTRMVRCFRG